MKQNLTGRLTYCPLRLEKQCHKHGARYKKLENFVLIFMIRKLPYPLLIGNTSFGGPNNIFTSTCNCPSLRKYFEKHLKTTAEQFRIYSIIAT